MAGRSPGGAEPGGREAPGRDEPDDARVVLAFDTATSVVVVALGTAGGRLLAEDAWPADHRHGETLLPRIARLLEASGVDRSAIEAVGVGTGPGAFTGLRVGLATAKGLAAGLGVPIVGVSTGELLIEAAAALDGAPPERLVLLLPAGPSDRVVVRRGVPPALLPGPSEPEVGRGERLVAVDLDGRAPPDALERGEAARRGLGRVLFAAVGARVRAGLADDLAELVPVYVTLPRGIRAAEEVEAWSPALR